MGVPGIADQRLGRAPAQAKQGGQCGAQVAALFDQRFAALARLTPEVVELRFQPVKRCPLLPHGFGCGQRLAA